MPTDPVGEPGSPDETQLDQVVKDLKAQKSYCHPAVEGKHPPCKGCQKRYFRHVRLYCPLLRDAGA